MELVEINVSFSNTIAFSNIFLKTPSTNQEPNAESISTTIIRDFSYEHFSIPVRRPAKFIYGLCQWQICRLSSDARVRLLLIVKIIQEIGLKAPARHPSAAEKPTTVKLADPHFLQSAAAGGDVTIRFKKTLLNKHKVGLVIILKLQSRPFSHHPKQVSVEH
ncbi:unnamed protein product [Ceratitis capitata]|uniref:(Mediterranean fruit fly) hypothetical protein n=1 Tax=Ceratitis capitata TaxID=7213 RepID=A0A811UQH5_CERCA|nr:unnamed protein product [Ceratitis capitata]